MPVRVCSEISMSVSASSSVLMAAAASSRR
uniref:Uncharacterized protein n=1 Tax=Arundo donax TaxID=35708 RepID=A0A0A8ZEZ5_ARUDO